MALARLCRIPRTQRVREQVRDCRHRIVENVGEKLCKCGNQIPGISHKVVPERKQFIKDTTGNAANILPDCPHFPGHKNNERNTSGNQ